VGLPLVSRRGEEGKSPSAEESGLSNMEFIIKSSSAFLLLSFLLSCSCLAMLKAGEGAPWAEKEADRSRSAGSSRSGMRGSSSASTAEPENREYELLSNEPVHQEEIRTMLPDYEENMEKLQGKGLYIIHV
jgi:hypothetical protein